MNITLPKMKNCSDCPIRYNAVCSKCDEAELSELEEIKYYRTYDAGQTIFFAGDDLEFVGSIVSGVASLTRTMPDGRVQMVGLLLPSDFMGRPNRTTIESDIVAETDVMLCCFRRRPFEKLIESTPHVGQRLLEMTLDELDAAREWMLVLGRKTAREKIASLLSMIAMRTASLQMRKPTEGTEFILPITREAMGNYLGLTIETVSRQMSALKKDGLISFDGKRQIIVPDLEALLAETGDDSDGGFLN
ncbi:CRP/FNR family transcriptional regulator, anaerobic regulatory protein [Cognatiyoonia koreensis]|uniref:CRP/FNR family transcriptional regulator, anaerobic regulatory protein n=1 Tax=Cognatiyoonia koreensis TaxID=364200 RepID=A0A1I0RPF3_9RHOB|nr:Crp/Fnr family transcriptional regulator [Cognatiyoonia koreensis]SEW43071.1 CRP/FNR family transcriptional regulator, anaerobic regulatory protein [Cognatiyoonia koreensis]